MQREISLDTLRGLALVLLAINHLNSHLVIIAYQPIGFISGLELLVFVSGLVTGIIYNPISLQKRQMSMWQRAIYRAKDIYLMHIAVVILLVVAALPFRDFLSHYFPWTTLLSHDTWTRIALSASLLNQPAFLGVLPMYFVFMFMIPFVIQQLEKGRIQLVILLSGSVWLITQFGISLDGLLTHIVPESIPVHTAAFDILSWQFLFIMGVCIGFWRRTHQKESCIPPRTSLFLVCLGLTGLFFLIYHGHRIVEHEKLGHYVPQLLINIDQWINTIIDWDQWTERRNLAPLRLLNFIVAAYIIAKINIRFPQLFNWSWFAWLGQHALQVYAFHQIVVFAVAPLQIHKMGFITDSLITLALLSTLSIPAWIHQHYREYLRKKSNLLNP